MVMTRLLRGRLPLVCAFAIVGLGIAACGSSSSSTSASGGSSSGGSSSGSSSSSNPTLAALQATVQAHEKDPTQIAPTVPISKPIPTGKHIVYVNCGAPACTQMGQSFTQAAQALGWTVSDIVATPTPAGLQAAFQNAIALHPDAVVSDGLTAAAYEHQIQELHAAHAFVVSNNGTDATGQNGIDLQVGPVASTDAGNRLLADKVIVDNGGKGDIGEVLLTGYPIVADYAAAFNSEVKAKCPSCTISTIQVQPTDIGSGSAGKIANFLRVHPNIKQVYLTYDTLALGLQAAVKGAGVSFPKLYSWAIDDSGLAAAKAGQRAAVVPECYPETGWMWADGLARLFTGQSIQPDEAWEQFPIWSNDYHNLPASDNNPPCNPNYQAQFKALWHK
jgi:ABC-type sugar transport system substrate-binding protein